MDELRNSDARARQPGCFQIDTVHTADDQAPWFTGYRPRPDLAIPDRRVALRLWLNPESGGRISVLLTADDEHTYGKHHQLAVWNALPANAWTAAVAPTVAAHPWAAHTHHGWKKHNGGNRLLRAALAYILTH